MLNAISLNNCYRGKKKSNNLGETPFILPPSHFKDVTPISPTETLDVAIPAETVKNSPSKTEENVATPTETTPIIEKAAAVPAEAKPEKNISGTNIPKRVRKVSALSLSSIKEKHKIKQEFVANEPDAENLPTEPFTEEQMIEGWNEFTEIIAKEGRHILNSHLRMGAPKLEGTLLHLVFPNQTIKVEMEREKHELLQFLRKKLQNYDIDLSIEVDEKEMKRYAYTTKEKYEKLVAVNPLLEELRKTFDLDI